MSTQLQTQLRKVSRFDYWLHNGSEPGKGELQKLIDELPAITNTILQGGDLTLADQIIIHTAIFAGPDLQKMSQKWPQMLADMRANLTPEEVSQAESNKSIVLALNAQVTQLLRALQNACNSHNRTWAEVEETVTRNVRQSYKGARKRHEEKVEQSGVGEPRELEMLLLQLKDYCE